MQEATRRSLLQFATASHTYYSARGAESILFTTEAQGFKEKYGSSKRFDPLLVTTCSTPRRDKARSAPKVKIPISHDVLFVGTVYWVYHQGRIADAHVYYFLLAS